MKHARSVGLAVTAILAVCSVVASVAFATSPKANTLTGEGFPLALSGSSATDRSELQNAAGVLKGEGVTLSGELTSASAGTYSAVFTNVEDKGEKCNNTGTAGEVRVPASGSEPFTLVHDASATTGVGALLEVATELTVTCGATKVKVKGNVVANLSPEGGGEKTTGFTGELHCSATVGEPARTKYWNAANEEKSPLLLANFGTGFKKACEEVVTNLPLTAAKMVELVS